MLQPGEFRWSDAYTMNANRASQFHSVSGEVYDGFLNSWRVNFDRGQNFYETEPGFPAPLSAKIAKQRARPMTQEMGSPLPAYRRTIFSAYQECQRRMGGSTANRNN